MNLYSIVLVGLGLSMDAFAASITNGVAHKKEIMKKAVLTAIFFGGFQALMPLIGYAFGCSIKNLIIAYDHWVAFVLLMMLGIKMIKDAIVPIDEEDQTKLQSEYTCLFIAAVATSVDALVVGLSFSVLSLSILIPAIIIGVITFFMAFAGVNLGNRFGHFFGNKIGILGGVMLCFIGIKILLEHLY